MSVIGTKCVCANGFGVTYNGLVAKYCEVCAAGYVNVSGNCLSRESQDKYIYLSIDGSYSENTRTNCLNSYKGKIRGYFCIPKSEPCGPHMTEDN